MRYIILGVFMILMSVHATEELQSNEIDVVNNLLNDLKNNAQSELDLLTQQWEQNQSRKQSVITTLQQSTQQQRGECNSRDQDVANKERDITITLSFINWLEKRIKENNDRLSLLDANRCDSNSNFINDVKNSKQLLNMIQFLRNSIRNANERDLPALLQKSEFGVHFSEYLKDTKVLVQLRQDEGQSQEEQQQQAEQQSDDGVNQEVPPEQQQEEELGSGPVTQVEVQAQPVHEQQEIRENQELQAEADALAQQVASDPRPAQEDSSNPSGNSVQYTQAQQELLNLLDSIEQEISGKFSRVQDNQVKSAMGYRDFKGLILKENQAFSEHIVQENENLKKLQNQLITALQVTAQCKARLKQISQALEFANEDFQSAQDNYNQVRERLEQEVQLFGDVTRIYSTQVGSQTDSYKSNVQSKIRA